MSEVFYRIVDNEVRNSNDFAVGINRHTRTMCIVTPVLYYRRQIPEGGFEFHDFCRMATRVGIRKFRLAARLNQRRFRGIAGPMVDAMAALHNVRLSPSTAFRPRLHALETVPADESCAICLEEGGEGWSTAEGCSRHRFHAKCIGRWDGRTCPMCRAQLRD